MLGVGIDIGSDYAMELGFDELEVSKRVEQTFELFLNLLVRSKAVAVCSVAITIFRPNNTETCLKQLNARA